MKPPKILKYGNGGPTGYEKNVQWSPDLLAYAKSSSGRPTGYDQNTNRPVYTGGELKTTIDANGKPIDWRNNPNIVRISDKIYEDRGANTNGFNHRYIEGENGSAYMLPVPGNYTPDKVAKVPAINNTPPTLVQNANQTFDKAYAEYKLANPGAVSGMKSGGLLEKVRGYAGGGNIYSAYSDPNNVGFKTYNQGDNSAIAGAMNNAISLGADKIMPGLGAAYQTGVQLRNAITNETNQIDPNTGKFIHPNLAAATALASPSGWANLIKYGPNGLEKQNEKLVTDAKANQQRLQQQQQNDTNFNYNLNKSIQNRMSGLKKGGLVAKLAMGGDIMRTYNTDQGQDIINQEKKSLPAWATKDRTPMGEGVGLSRPMFSKGGGVKAPMIKKSQGGKIEGAGTAKSDSISAKVKEKSFVVPAENSEKAEELREKVLGNSKDKKANLNQSGGTKVKLSNGEHLFTPEEVKELEKHGIDVDDLAPYAENALHHFKDGGLTPEKAHQILKDGTIRGVSLTNAQKRFFGWMSSQ